MPMRKEKNCKTIPVTETVKSLEEWAVCWTGFCVKSITLTVAYYEGEMTGLDKFKPSKNNAYTEISKTYFEISSNDDDQF